MPSFGLPYVTESDNPLPDLITGYVSVAGKKSVFAPGVTGLEESAKAYHASAKDLASVRRELESFGFIVLAGSELGFSVAAGPAQFEEITGGTVLPFERLMQTARGVREYITCLDIVGSKQPDAMGVGKAKSAALRIDGICLEQPKQCHSIFPSPIPPASPKFHLRLPGDLAVAMGAQQARQRGFRGDGITVAMPDTGWYRHPYFTANQYKIQTPLVTVPGTNPSKDPVGHGTGESANIFALAPGVVLQPVRATDSAGRFVGAMAAFLKSKALVPRIITNSWGGDGLYPPIGGPSAADLALAAEIKDAIEKGILVIFSAGNGQFAIEPQVPGVLSAGGVYLDPMGRLQASSYASGYASPWFPDVVVPTACGLVGMQPRAQYLMLPVQPGCELDQSEATIADGEAGDGTTGTDGWAMFSGTSAAAPQLAGAAALILGAKPALRPAQVIEALSKTAVDVLSGHSFPQRFNEPAGPGRDLATGWGLINASAAVDYAISNF
ncbi:MAG: S8 family serine peptidase [Burkholderiales bacterium]|jgi:subtilisin family serine protease|nr:S8 family serine peptidase [Burkholderiales bacterium]